MDSPVLYLLPGLGLDERIFSKLELPGYDCHYLNWFDPLSPRESIESYAQRMAKKIDTSAPVILIGHSFGGVMAQEISRHIPVKQIILISSIKSKGENRVLLRLVGRLGLQRFFSKGLVVQTFFLWAGLNGYRNREQRELLLDMYRKNSNRYLRWSLKEISLWDPEPVDTPIIHLHGTRDVTFPIKNIQEPVIRVEDGWHFMVYQKPKEVTQLILEHMEPSSTS